MTAKELSDFLLQQKAWWQLNGYQSSGLRRDLFRKRDAFHFSRPDPLKPEVLTLNVLGTERDSAGRRRAVLGAPLTLTFGQVGDPNTKIGSGFLAETAGRAMAFGRVGDRLVYECLYLAGPHGQPDESGEGDPMMIPPP